MPHHGSSAAATSSGSSSSATFGTGLSEIRPLISGADKQSGATAGAAAPASQGQQCGNTGGAALLYVTGSIGAKTSFAAAGGYGRRRPRKPGALVTPPDIGVAVVTVDPQAASSS